MGKGKKRRGKQSQTQQHQNPENEDEHRAVGDTSSQVSEGTETPKEIATSHHSKATASGEKRTDPKQVENIHDKPPQQQDVRKKEPLRQKSGPIKSATGGSTITNNKRNYEPQIADRQDKTVGKLGRKISLQANHFEMKIKIPNGSIYHYDMQFQFPWKREVRKFDRPFLIRVAEELKEKYKSVFIKPNTVVHDGFKNMYSCFKLNTLSDFEGSVETVTDGENQKKIEMKVKIKYVGSVEVQWAVEEYLRVGTTLSKPNDAVQILNIILGMTPQLHYVTLGRNYFNPVKGESVIDLDGTKSLWVGTFQSVRLGWKPMLNIDMANKPAYEAMKITDFVNKLLKPPRGSRLTEIKGRDLKKVEDELKQLKIKFSRPDGQKRDYRVNKLMASAQELKMKLGAGQVITIEKYFQTQYDCKLSYPKLPCLHVGDPKKTIYLPMELCELKKQVAPRSKLLSKEEAACMIKKTALASSERKKRICSILNEMKESFSTDPYANAFGISVSNQMVQIDGRILDPPLLKYKYPRGEDGRFPLPKGGGKWNMGTDQNKFQFHTGAKLECWGVLDTANLKNERENFVNALYDEAISRGLVIDYPTYETANENNVEDVEKKFKILHENLSTYGEPQLIMVLVSRKTNIRSRIKLLGDSVYGIPTQFVMKRNVVGKFGNINSQTLHNICLKLNNKLKGINQVLLEPPKLMQIRVMIMGADVTHPSPADTGKKPSIAAVVASCDRNISKYHYEARLQYADDAMTNKVVEVIKDMEQITRTLLEKFAKVNGSLYPCKIIYYRDGVSEGEFPDVLNKEMSAMRRACESINRELKTTKRDDEPKPTKPDDEAKATKPEDEPKTTKPDDEAKATKPEDEPKPTKPAYEPQITFIVAQKRHKTRLFPSNPKDAFGRMRNVPPGTVVDTKITHPREYDFFLASHEGIQGTTKPTHYHLLWDDSDFSIDELESLTYQLCHLYSRCERSVSYAAPTYYAHLAAFRAREHHNALLEKYGSSENIPKEDIDRIENFHGINFFI